MKKVIIVGTSRKNGDTWKVVDEMTKHSTFDVIDLSEYKIGYFDYGHKNIKDDFLPLMKTILKNYETLVFATPVYWYSMSGTMKVFFDRITDLLTIEKDLGRKLRSKKMAAISTSGGNNLGEAFWLPFSESADYLGMKYLGHLHTFPEKLDIEEIAKFVGSVSVDS